MHHGGVKIKKFAVIEKGVDLEEVKAMPLGSILEGGWWWVIKEKMTTILSSNNRKSENWTMVQFPLRDKGQLANTQFKFLKWP